MHVSMGIFTIIMSRAYLCMWHCKLVVPPQLGSRCEHEVDQGWVQFD